MSSPGGLSVNDGIDPDEFTLQYITVDQIIRMISTYGVGALIAKFDVEAAYRNIAVHPSDRYLLGLKWRKNYYVDLALTFWPLFGSLYFQFGGQHGGVDSPEYPQRFRPSSLFR